LTAFLVSENYLFDAKAFRAGKAPMDENLLYRNLLIRVGVYFAGNLFKKNV
jgi:hypothetical protein